MSSIQTGTVASPGARLIALAAVAATVLVASAWMAAPAPDEVAVRAALQQAPARLVRAVERLSVPNDDAAPARPAPRLDYHDRMGFVKVADIVSIASDGDYSVVRLASGRTHRARKSLREWLARLPENAFARVHRSTIVNLEYVERVEEWSHLSYRLYLRGASEPVAMSRRHAGKLKR
jgi:DNA-binding LytR/AlgR family response regulator